MEDHDDREAYGFVHPQLFPNMQHSVKEIQDEAYSCGRQDALEELKGYRKVPSVEKLTVILEPLVTRDMFDSDVDIQYRPRFLRQIESLARDLHERLMEER